MVVLDSWQAVLNPQHVVSINWGGAFNSCSTNVTGHNYQGPGTWGWDDCAWYAQLPVDCRNYWLDDQTSKVQSFTTYGSFMCVPGRFGTTGCGSYMYQLVDHPSTISVVQNMWRVSTQQPTYRVHAEPCDGNTVGICRVPPEILESRLPAITLVVNNPEKSSIYSWHIRKPNNTWEPIQYGASLVYYPNAVGSHLIGLRKDNLGLPASNYGSASSSGGTIGVAKRCCDPNLVRSGSTSRDIDSVDAKPNITLEEMNNMERIALQTRLLNGDAVEYKSFITELEMYPQPAKEEVVARVNLLETGVYSATITTILGQDTRYQVGETNVSAGQHDLRIDLSDLAPGVYVYRFTFNGLTRNARIVKQ